MTKRGIIVFLAGVNFVLLVMLLAATYRPPAAFAQAGGRGGSGFVTVAAKAPGQGFDVLYALDTTTRRLHAFHPTPQGDKVIHADFRDLAIDFERKK
jgi:hypothetical protein